MLGTTTDGTTQGLREFKLQIFIVLQMGDIKKEPRRDNNNKIEMRAKILIGDQRQGWKKNNFFVVTKQFCSLFLHLKTGFNISPKRLTDIKVRWAVVSNMNASASTYTQACLAEVGGRTQFFYSWPDKSASKIYTCQVSGIFYKTLINFILIKYLILEFFLPGRIVTIKWFSGLSSTSPWQLRCPLPASEVM